MLVESDFMCHHCNSSHSDPSHRHSSFHSLFESPFLSCLVVPAFFVAKSNQSCLLLRLRFDQEYVASSVVAFHALRLFKQLLVQPSNASSDSTRQNCWDNKCLSTGS